MDLVRAWETFSVELPMNNKNPSQRLIGGEENCNKTHISIKTHLLVFVKVYMFKNYFSRDS